MAFWPIFKWWSGCSRIGERPLLKPFLLLLYNAIADLALLDPRKGGDPMLYTGGLIVC
jgi:hypothetical protein